MTVQAVIFDLDDTLLDTSALLAARDRRDWRSVFSRLAEARPFEVKKGEMAVARLPAAAKQRGLAVGMYTQSPQSYATELMKAHRIRVDQIVSGSDRYPSKPDPTGLIAVARLLQVECKRCIYVGDSVGDFGAAAAAGMASVGVAWSRKVPAAWRDGWPDVAIDRPSLLLDLLGGAGGLGQLAEVVARAEEPKRHWGSVVRLGGDVFGLGRYFPTRDRRHPHHALSCLIVESKSKAAARRLLAACFAPLAQPPSKYAPTLVVSVPPAPGDERDRFATARTALAEAFDTRERGDVLTMRHKVDDYKGIPRRERGSYNMKRFESSALKREQVLLIDDVWTSGSQAVACREALLAAGAERVVIVVAGVTQKALPTPCPVCGDEFGGILRTKRRRRDGKEFLACSAPQCDYSQDVPSA